MSIIDGSPGASESAASGSGWRAEPLVAVVQELSLARDLAAIMQIVRTAARDLTGADGASFVLRDGDLCYYAEENAIGPLWRGQRFPMSACVSGWAMLHREAAVIEDIEEDDRVPVEAYRPTFVRSLAMVPIRARAPIGAIGCYWSFRHRATPHELGLLQALADSTSVAMENVEVHAELEKRVRDRTRELEARTSELAAAHAALLEVQQQKQALSEMVVHDLRSPASALMLTAGTQLGGADLPAADRRRWCTVFASAEHILRTADNLLDIAGSEEGKLAPRLAEVDLGGLLSEIRERLLPLAERCHQRIEVQLGEPGCAVRADRELLGRVLQNLLDNALRYSPLRSAVRLEGHLDGEWAHVAVCDEGPGIEPDLRERVFDRHVRLAKDACEREGGRGLGLTFCRLAVEAHGGAIWIEDNEPRGSRFCLRVPAAAATEEAPSQGRPNEGAAGEGPSRRFALAG